MNKELVRANKVVVKAVDDTYVADFYKTHKHIAKISAVETGWKAKDGMTKIGMRESFRAYVVEHAGDYGVEWNPSDMRAEENKRKPKYENDDMLMDDVILATIDDFKALTEKCRYDVTWKGMEVDEIKPKKSTSKGVKLPSLGIDDGKYKSGNWAWADIPCTITLCYKKQEVYLQTIVELVSGQIKKPKIGINTYNDMVKNELIVAGLATNEELNPIKDKQAEQEDAATAEQEAPLKTEDEVNKIRRKADAIEYAKSIGCNIDDAENQKLKDLKVAIIEFQK